MRNRRRTSSVDSTRVPRGVGLLERLLVMCTRVAIFFRYVCGQYAQASDMLEMSLECAELWYCFAHAVVQQLRNV